MCYQAILSILQLNNYLKSTFKTCYTRYIMKSKLENVRNTFFSET